MKILAMTDLSGHMVGGPTTAAVELLNGLSRRGHEVLLVNDHPYPGLVDVEHLCLSISATDATLHQIRRLLLDFEPDVVHVLSMGQKTLRRLAHVLADRPWIVTLHSLSPHERIVRGWHRNHILHYALRNLRYLPNTAGWYVLLRTLTIPRIIVHSRSMERVALRYGAKATSLRVVDLASAAVAAPGASDPRSVSPAPRIVTVAGVAHTKGLHDAVEAIAILRPRYPGISYCIVGEVRDTSYLRFVDRLTTALGLQDVVEVRQRIPSAEKDALLADASLYLQPSHEEGFCLAYLEAAHRVERLVATSTGAMVEISGSDTWMKVVRPGDVRALAVAIEALLRAPGPSTAELKTRQKRLSTQFSWARHVGVHEGIYEELVPTRLARA